jgi:hypothetical protein
MRSSAEDPARVADEGGGPERIKKKWSQWPLRKRGSGVDDCCMASKVVELPGIHPRVPTSTDNGLWDALLAHIDPRSAAGSRLAGLRPGQPLPAAEESGDGVAMFTAQPSGGRPRPRPAA